MPSQLIPDSGDEAFWRDFLTHGDTRERRLRNVFRHIPSNPRCKICAAPFTGPGAPVMRMIGKRPAIQNPHVCSQCFTFLAAHHGGAEVDITLLFADIRGSTTIAEGMSSTEYRQLLDRFYTVATSVVFDHGGMVDKFVGDELVAMFVPLFTGDRHAMAGIEAAKALLVATGHADARGPWVPVGAGIHSGPTWFGAVGQGRRTELTAVGDGVNVTARLASMAAAGEILVTTEAAAAAGLDPSLERRSLELKGKTLAIEVVSVTVSG